MTALKPLLLSATRAGYVVGGEGGLDRALADWLESARQVRQSLATSLSKSL